MTIMVVAVVLQKATEHLHPSTGVRMPHSDQGRRLPASVQRLSASPEWGHLLARASGNRVGRVYVANEDPPRLRRSASRRHRRRWLPHRTVWQQRGGQPCWLFCARPVEAQTRVQPQTCRFHQVWERYGTSLRLFCRSFYTSYTTARSCKLIWTEHTVFWFSICYWLVYLHVLKFNFQANLLEETTRLIREQKLRKLYTEESKSQQDWADEEDNNNKKKKKKKKDFVRCMQAHPLLALWAGEG